MTSQIDEGNTENRKEVKVKRKEWTGRKRKKKRDEEKDKTRRKEERYLKK